jgi:hypothetical protein
MGDIAALQRMQRLKSTPFSAPHLGQVRALGSAVMCASLPFSVHSSCGRSLRRFP